MLLFAIYNLIWSHIMHTHRCPTGGGNNMKMQTRGSTARVKKQAHVRVNETICSTGRLNVFGRICEE